MPERREVGQYMASIEEEKRVRRQITWRMRRRFLFIAHVLIGIAVIAVSGKPPVIYIHVAQLILLALVPHLLLLLYFEAVDRGVRREIDRRYQVQAEARAAAEVEAKRKNEALFGVANGEEPFISDAPDDYDYMAPHLGDTGEFVPDDRDSYYDDFRKRRSKR